MGEFTLEIDVDELMQIAERWREASSAIDTIMNTTMHETVAIIEQPVRAETPVNIGQTRASWTSEVKGRGPDLVGRVFNVAPWGMALEVGRKAGKMPPVDAIQYWVERKGIARGEDSRQVAFVIARAIGRRGTKGAHMAEKGMAKARPIVVRLWQDAAGKIREALT